MRPAKVRFFGILTLVRISTSRAIAQTPPTVTLRPMLGDTFWQDLWSPRVNTQMTFDVNLTGVSNKGTLTVHRDDVSRWGRLQRRPIGHPARSVARFLGFMSITRKSATRRRRWIKPEETSLLRRRQ